MLLAFGGVTKYAFGSELILRPPGGQDEDHFIATCIKCDRCRSACPLNCIAVANMNDGLLNARTPKMDYHKGYCNFCVDQSKKLCIANCPTGALKDFDFEKEWISPAIIDTTLCIAYAPEGGGCRKCVDVCIYGAITLDDYSRPLVDTSKCNGCGRCEYICPSNSYKRFSGIRKRAITIEATERPRSGGGAS